MSSKERAGLYREKAREALELAKRASTAQLRASYIRMAEGWSYLADLVERMVRERGG